MTVKELKEKLEEFPDDTEVVVPVDEGDCYSSPVNVDVESYPDAPSEVRIVGRDAL